MMGSFDLTIELGDDAMQDVEDVGRALEKQVVEELLRGEREGVILDENGNTVGHWTTRED